jgi:hypothetical protein
VLVRSWRDPETRDGTLPSRGPQQPFGSERADGSGQIDQRAVRVERQWKPSGVASGRSGIVLSRGDGTKDGQRFLQ